jgi:hypothetical protein
MMKRDKTASHDKWGKFRDEDCDPIRVSELKLLNLGKMPEDIHIWVMDDYFPETTISRHGEFFICWIEEHLYTKYWEHKFSAYAFAEAMERAVVRLAQEGHPVSDPSRDDDDVQIFVSWQLRLPCTTKPELLAESVRSAFDLVWQRSDAILEKF